MRHRPSTRLHQLENDPSYAPRRYPHPLWVDERDTPADIEAKRERAIAAGLASADDQFVLVRWRRRDGS
jgi:hypothetical protein